MNNVTQIRFVRTIVGAWNLYLVNHAEQPRKTVSPLLFEELFPQVSPKTRFGCGTISTEFAAELFGSVSEVRSA